MVILCSNFWRHEISLEHPASKDDARMFVYYQPVHLFGGWQTRQLGAQPRGSPKGVAASLSKSDEVTLGPGGGSRAHTGVPRGLAKARGGLREAPRATGLCPRPAWRALRRSGLWPGTHRSWAEDGATPRAMNNVPTATPAATTMQKRPPATAMALARDPERDSPFLAPGTGLESNFEALMILRSS